MSTATADLYYDPYDFEIDADPYPVWKRMRDEQPLYYNEKHDFWAVTRWDDVEAALKDHGRLISSHGTILELIKANIEMPPGMVIFDDPPSHTAYRGLMSRVFTPRKMNAIEPEVRRYCQIELDALEGQNEFDIIQVLAAKMPMRVIGMLLGIPEADQQAIRDHSDQGLHLDSADDFGARFDEFSFENRQIVCQKRAFDLPRCLPRRRFEQVNLRKRLFVLRKTQVKLTETAFEESIVADELS